MRIAVAGLSHETNTYAVASTGMTTEERFLALTGEAIRERFTGTGWAVGGILDECARREDDAVPAFFAWAEPSGTIDSAAYAALKEHLLQALRAAMPVDAVALELHGAGVVEGIDDLEADLGGAIRRLVGPDVPIAATLDLHGNATPAMADAYDLLLGCHLYPHTDLYDRGVEAVELLHRVVEEGLRPVVHVEQLPILLPPSTTDGDSPATRANQVCAQLEARPGVIRSRTSPTRARRSSPSPTATAAWPRRWGRKRPGGCGLIGRTSASRTTRLSPPSGGQPTPPASPWSSTSPPTIPGVAARATGPISCGPCSPPA